MLWLSMDKTNCKTAARSIQARPRHREQAGRVLTPASRPRRSPATRSPAIYEMVRGSVRRFRSRIALKGSADESIQAVHFAAGLHHVVVGGDFANRFCRVPATACFRASTGRLPHDSGTNLLSRREPGCDGVIGNRAARASVWPSPRTEPDDLHELLRKLAHYASVRPQPQYRCGRAG